MQRIMPAIEQLPYALYRAEQVRRLDQIAIQVQGIPSTELMQRAGAACYRQLRKRWPACRHITVLCGVGNNGGDGFVVATHARRDGLQVQLIQLGDINRMSATSSLMRDAYSRAGGHFSENLEIDAQADIIVDALLGTGMDRPVEGYWSKLIDEANKHPAAVVAVDIPSGLHADKGIALGNAIQADMSVSFIGLKQGMFTGDGRALSGEIRFDALSVPASVYAAEILSARRIEWARFAAQLSRRPDNSHKGDFGHVLAVGGAPGMSGAIRLCAEAALRAGAGMVSVATHTEHAACLNAGRPELMVQGVRQADEMDDLLRAASVIVIGPGLGLSDWGESLLNKVLASNLPLVVDADGLNLLGSRQVVQHPHCVLTPHPGEAARLLGCDVEAVQEDRFAAATELQRRYAGVVVLKGAGTLVALPGSKPPAVCSQGNPGMATAGMGDVLAGIIAAFIAQGHNLADAAEMGVCLHSAAADEVAKNGQTGMLASDLFPHIRPLLHEPV